MISVSKIVKLFLKTAGELFILQGSEAGASGKSLSEIVKAGAAYNGNAATKETFLQEQYAGKG